MKIIKRSGTEMNFDAKKITAAISKANREVPAKDRLSKEQIDEITTNVENICIDANRSLSVEEIQDLVEEQIMNKRAFGVARKYITYRYDRALVRKSNSTDKQILSLLECSNEEVKQENSNKNPTVNSVQRDYMAGEVSKDITRRFLLPSEVIRAHEQGIIHFHDSDYFAQHMHNCCLVNLDDMLQNGTVISETMIERPKSFSTACNIATQSIAQIASCQYGGQSISLSHLAPFVQVSREKFCREVRREIESAGIEATEEQIRQIFRFIGTFKSPDTFLLVDPVMGDDGDTYCMYTPSLLAQMKKLASMADIITPNLTELCLLTDAGYHALTGQKDTRKMMQEIQKLGQEFCRTGPAAVVVTGIHFLDDSGGRQMGNLYINEEGSSLFSFPYVGGSYSGTGDLFASCMAAGIARGDSVPSIIKTAGKFLELALKDSVREQVPRNDGVNYEKYLPLLIESSHMPD